MKTVRVLIVDDSEMFRTLIRDSLTAKGSIIEIVGTANDPFDATEKINSLNPDVMTLDVEMPRMNGIEFLKRLIPQKKIPTVVCTSSPVQAFEAVSAGAVDYIRKPTVNDRAFFADELRRKVIIAASAKTFSRPSNVALSNASAPRPVYFNAAKMKNALIAIGASTGGTEALQVVVENMPANAPGVVIVQHMPAGFTKMFAERLDRVCKMRVKEAKDGDRIQPGLIIIGAGEHQLCVKKDALGYYVSSKPGEKVSGHCPSVDVLFSSVAESAGANAVAAILTGMGSDGAKGLLKLRQTGAYTVGQDKDSCVVYGMPMVAFNIGAVVKQAPLTSVMDLLLQRFK